MSAPVRPSPWPEPATPTGIGSMPGTDSREAANVVAGECGDFPFIAELPARGPGADSVGRTAAMLASVDRSFEVETTTSGWRVGHTGQSDLRRARAWLGSDIDAFEEFSSEHSGVVGVRILGPWTLAARIEDAAGESLIRDPGAVAEIASGSAQAAGDLVARIRRSVPDCTVVVNVDEPELVRVLEGRVRMSSGRLSHRAIEPGVVQARLAEVMNGIRDRSGVPAMRVAVPRAPLDLIVGASPDVVYVDIGLALPDDDALPRSWEAGVGLVVGCVSTDVQTLRSDEVASSPLRELMDRSGFSEVPPNVAISPRTGLAHLDQSDARTVMKACTRVGAVVRDEHPEVVGG